MAPPLLLLGRSLLTTTRRRRWPPGFPVQMAAGASACPSPATCEEEPPPRGLPSRLPAAAPWRLALPSSRSVDGFRLVDLEGNRAPEEWMFASGFTGPVFTVLSGQQGCGTESLQLQGCTWHLWWSQPTQPSGLLSMCARSSPKAEPALFSPLLSCQPSPPAVLSPCRPFKGARLAPSSPFCGLCLRHTVQHVPTTGPVISVRCMDLFAHGACFPSTPGT